MFVQVPLYLLFLTLACTLLAILGWHFDKKAANDIAELQERMYLKYGKLKEKYIPDPFDALERRQKKLNDVIEEEDDSACGRCRSCLWTYFKCWDCTDLLSRRRKLRDLWVSIREDHPIVSMIYPLPLDHVFFNRTQKVICFYCELNMCAAITGYYFGTDQGENKRVGRPRGCLHLGDLYSCNSDMKA